MSMAFFGSCNMVIYNINYHTISLYRGHVFLAFFRTSHLTQSFCNICCSSPAGGIPRKPCGFEVEGRKLLEVVRLKSEV